MKLHALIPLLFAARAFAVADPTPQQSGDLSLRNEVQLAIDKGLACLKKAQSADGSWSLPDQPALTALPLTAFMLEPGETFRTEKPEFIKKGYDFLLASVQPDGGIYRKGLANYNTSLCLVALAAAKDPKYTPAIQAARNFVISQQVQGLVDTSLDGGIGYGSDGKHPDLSNTATALDALHLTKSATVEGAPHAKDLDWAAVVGFVQRCQNLPATNKEKWVSDAPEDKGGFVYYPGSSKAGETTSPDGKKTLRSYGSISYAGLLSYLYADLKKDDPRVTAVVDWVSHHYTLTENPGMGSEGLYYYYRMMAKALAAYGVKEIQLPDGAKLDWRKDLALKLINMQKSDGSWSNEAGRWMEKDSVLVTAYSVFTLEIIYHTL